MAIHFEIHRSGRSFGASADGSAPAFIGFQTAFTDKGSGQDFVGLFNVPTRDLPKLVFRADDHRDRFGFWADFIEPTSHCEGGNFLTLNTYDRAKFTWGFGQFGAHVPDGDFVVFFRDLLTRPEASDYFPDLAVKSDRICRVTGGRVVPLETSTSTEPLMAYLNPTTRAVEDAEVIAAAKLMHWTTTLADARSLQVLHMVGTFQRLMREADQRLGLDGKSADLCLVICDIRHQGRAKFAAMLAALGSGEPLGALLSLGSIAYPDRIKTLRKELKARSRLFAGLHWSRSKGDFV